MAIFPYQPCLQRIHTIKNIIIIVYKRNPTKNYLNSYAAKTGAWFCDSYTEINRAHVLEWMHENTF